MPQDSLSPLGRSQPLSNLPCLEVNLQGISGSVFFAEEALLYDDPDHSDEELRFLLVGPSASLRLLVVVHCQRGTDDVVRIISARAATRSERKAFVAERSR